MVRSFEIAGRPVGPAQPCLIIAEAGVNHNGDPDMARRLVDAAVEAGADAVKFQTFVPDELVAPGARKAAYQLEGTYASESQLDMLKRLSLSREDFSRLRDHCRARDILFMSTPFEAESADFLEALGIPAFKMPSGEITNLPFLEHVARKGKPMIVSTGMAWLGEVEAAVRAIKGAGGPPLALLHCVSTYPAAPADVNLRAMRAMEAAFDVPIGYSDHTPGMEVALAAVALGACILEKHFTLDRTLPGPDHRASLEPEELSKLVEGVRTVEASLGHGRKEPATSEADTAAVARKSLVAAQDIPAGTPLTEAMIAIRRPGTGLPPAFRPYLIGRTAREFIPAGSMLALEQLT